MHQGLNPNDRFNDLLMTKPHLNHKVFDEHAVNKLPARFEAVGKPNHLVSFSGLNPDHTVVMNQVGHLSAEELVRACDSRPWTKDGTTSGGRYSKFDLNKRRAVRVFETFDSVDQLNKNSYVNRQLRDNQHHAARINYAMASRGASNALNLEAHGQS